MIGKPTHRLLHPIIGAVSVAILVTWSATVVPDVLKSRSQLTNDQRADLYATGELLQKIDDMCAEADVDKQDAYLGASDEVVCVSFSGTKQIVGYLHGEGKMAEERFIRMHGRAPTAIKESAIEAWNKRMLTDTTKGVDLGA